MNLDQLDQALTGQQLTATDLVAAVGVLAIGTALAFLVGRVTRARFGRPDRQAMQIAQLVARLTRWLIQIVAIAWALEILGIGLGWVTVTVAILVVGVVLAARPLAENLASGAVLVSRPAFGIGDEVEVGGYVGEIIEITGRSTVLRLRDGRRVHLPNSEVLGQTVVVYTTEQARRTALDVTVGLDADLDRTERVILDALGGIDGIVDDPPPSVRAREFTHGVRLSARFWHPSRINEGNQARDAAVRAIKRALDEASIELAVPEIAVQTPGSGAA